MAGADPGGVRYNKLVAGRGVLMTGLDASQGAGTDLSAFVAGQTVPRLFLGTVADRPDAVALRWKDGDGWRRVDVARLRGARLPARDRPGRARGRPG